MNRKVIYKTMFEYAFISFAILLMDVGIYVFKFPNHFSFGGVSGLAVVLNEITGVAPGLINMIFKKYSTFDIGTTLILTDVVFVAMSFWVFDIRTGLFSVCGLVTKSIFVDHALDQMKLSKYFTIICNDPEPICAFIRDTLNRSATIYSAQGIYTHEGKTIILCALDPRQAVILERFIQKTEPAAFIMVTKSNETIGKGFHLTM